MKVLITGASGLLGKALLETASSKDEVHGTWFKNRPSGRYFLHQLDITSSSCVYQLVKAIKPDVIIHCAAEGRVDFAEKHYDAAFEINVTGTHNVLRAAKECWARVVYISSNAVFNGTLPPYDETSMKDPINQYGTLKTLAERLTKTSNGWLIVRPFLLYGWPNPGGRPNWATIVIDKLSKGEELPMVDDVIWMPTYVKDCAEAIWNLIDLENEIVHIAGPDRVSLMEFGRTVAQRFNLDASLLTPVPSSYFPNMAPRPKDTTYNLSKAKELGIECLGIEEGLRKMKEDQ